MEIKKSDKANLEKKRTLFFEIGLIITLLIVIMAFEWSTRPKEQKLFTISSDEPIAEEQAPVTKQEEVKAPPAPPLQVFDIKIVDNKLDVDSKLEDWNANVDLNDNIDIKPVMQEEESSDEEQPFIIVEDPPQFMGGTIEDFRRWVAENLKYPEVAQENGIQGKVFVKFVVDKEGRVTDVTVIRGVHPSLDQEAVRVIKSSPRWTPGRQRGRPVKVQFSIPVVFVLQ